MGKIVRFQKKSGKMEQKDVDPVQLREILNEIEGYLKGWLSQSNMTEEELLEYRTVNMFKVKEEEQGSNLIVRLTYIDDEKKEQMIGEPICIAKMDEEAKMNLCYLLLLVAAKLDDANKKNPVNGSYTKDYFRRRVSGYCKSKVMEEE